jgi:HEAT repeat protein
VSRSLLILAALLPSLAQAGWRDDVAASVAACASDPAPCEIADTLRIRESRAGIWFAQDDRLQPAVLGPLLHRLERETEPQVRVAIAHAASILFDEADASWHPAWAELAASDRDAGVRSVLMSGLRKAPMSVAGPGLRKALQHADPDTRLLAAAKMGGHAQAADFVDDLLAALPDPDADVRLRVVRALGSARDARALPALRAVDTSDEAMAREVERAIRRIQEG